MASHEKSFSRVMLPLLRSFFFFFNDTATTEIYTLSLHDALPICHDDHEFYECEARGRRVAHCAAHFIWRQLGDRKSTRLNSSHLVISYAVFCLKKKKNNYSWIAYPHESVCWSIYQYALI